MNTDISTMNQPTISEDAPEEAASDWVVRLQDADAGEAEWLAFDAWLETSPTHAQAYDRALALWQEVDSHAPAIKSHLATPARTRRLLPMVGGGALAAALALGWVLTGTGPSRPAVEIYQTGKGERKSVTLADGSRIDLAASSHLSVSLGSAERQVTLDEGEAIFDVAPDSHRPFVIAAADRQVRVVGTEFDVRRRDDQLSVTVRRGIVEVAPIAPAQGQAMRLTPGDRIDHRIGTTAVQASIVSADDVFAWRAGHPVYRDRPLSEVAADLNAQFVRPVLLADRRTADLRFSGVLVLDDEEGVVHRLTLLAPLWSTSDQRGIVIGAKEGAGQ
jgi:transmembrane sensor